MSFLSWTIHRRAVRWKMSGRVSTRLNSFAPTRNPPPPHPTYISLVYCRWTECKSPRSVIQAKTGERSVKWNDECWLASSLIAKVVNATKYTSRFIILFVIFSAPNVKMKHSSSFALSSSSRARKRACPSSPAAVSLRKIYGANFIKEIQIKFFFSYFPLMIAEVERNCDMMNGP